MQAANFDRALASILWEPSCLRPCTAVAAPRPPGRLLTLCLHPLARRCHHQQLLQALLPRQMLDAIARAAVASRSQTSCIVTGASGQAHMPADAAMQQQLPRSSNGPLPLAVALAV